MALESGANLGRHERFEFPFTALLEPCWSTSERIRTAARVAHEFGQPFGNYVHQCDQFRDVKSARDAKPGEVIGRPTAVCR